MNILLATAIATLAALGITGYLCAIADERRRASKTATIHDLPLMDALAAINGPALVADIETYLKEAAK